MFRTINYNCERKPEGYILYSTKNRMCLADQRKYFYSYLSIKNNLQKDNALQTLTIFGFLNKATRMLKKC